MLESATYVLTLLTLLILLVFRLRKNYAFGRLVRTITGTVAHDKYGIVIPSLATLTLPFILSRLVHFLFSQNSLNTPTLVLLDYLKLLPTIAIAIISFTSGLYYPEWSRKRNLKKDFEKSLFLIQKSIEIDIIPKYKRILLGIFYVRSFADYTTEIEKIFSDIKDLLNRTQGELTQFQADNHLLINIPAERQLAKLLMNSVDMPYPKLVNYSYPWLEKLDDTSRSEYTAILTLLNSVNTYILEMIDILLSLISKFHATGINIGSGVEKNLFEMLKIAYQDSNGAKQQLEQLIRVEENISKKCILESLKSLHLKTLTEIKRLASKHHFSLTEGRVSEAIISIDFKAI